MEAAHLLGVLSRLSAHELSADTELMQARDNLLDVAQTAWSAIEADWEKLELGFEVIAVLARPAPDLAGTFVADVNRLKRQLTIVDPETELAATTALRLATRVLGALAAKNLDSQRDRERLVGAIERLGSTRAQTRLLAELAVRLHLGGRLEDCQDIVQKHLVPLIYAVGPDNEQQRFSIVVDTSPALYVGASGTASALFASLPPPLRDHALARIITFLLRGVSPWDPYEERPEASYDINFETANRVIQVLEEMDEDWRIYSVIKALTESISHPTYSANFKGGQRAEVARQLDALSRKKFPTPRFIRHEGYLIAAQARINKLRDTQQLVPHQELAASARRIPNEPDKALVLSIIASTCRHAKERQQYLAEARQVADAIPMLGERLDLYESMSNMLVHVDEQRSKEILKKALDLAKSGEGDSLADRRQSLVALACQVHPDIAGSLASMTDDDPAKQRIERQLRLHEIKSALVRRRPAQQAPVVEDLFEWSRASWLQLGSLNAGRSAPVQPRKTLYLLDYVAKQTISRSYPILAWFVENAARFHKGTDAARGYLTPLLEASLLGAELAVRASTRVGAAPHALEVVSEPSRSESLLRAGEREEGLQFIRTWLTETMPKELYIVEPYFGPASMAALALIAETCDDCEVSILCGRNESLGSGTEAPEQIYMRAWRRERSDEPPSTTIIFVRGKTTEKCPIHDRWWLCSTSGIALGTSYNGIGARLSEIRSLSKEQAEERLREVLPYFTLSKKACQGERLEYSSCSL